MSFPWTLLTGGVGEGHPFESWVFKVRDSRGGPRGEDYGEVAAVRSSVAGGSDHRVWLAGGVGCCRGGGVETDGISVVASVRDRGTSGSGGSVVEAACVPDSDRSRARRPVVADRIEYREGPHLMAGRLGMARSTVYAVLARRGRSGTAPDGMR